MALDWLPIYPAAIREPILLGAAYQPHYAGAPFQIPSIAGWTAVYPSRIDRRRMQAGRVPAFFAPGDDRPALPTPDLAWRSTYPDRLARRPQTRLPALFAVPFFRATALETFAIYPDQIQRLRLHASAQLAEGLKLEGIPPALSWAPEYPARVWPKAALRPAAQLHYQFHPEPVPDPPPPGLGYTTVVAPDYIWPKIGLRPRLQQTFVVNVEPIPNPPPPTDFTSPPVFPDRVASLTSRRRPETRTAEALVPIGAAGSDLRWLPSYPLTHTRRAALPTSLSFQVGETLAIPITGQWRAHYPDAVRRRVNVNDFTGFDPLSVAALLPIPPECVEWTAEAFDVTGIVEADLTRATIAEEDAAGPTVGGEKGC